MACSECVWGYGDMPQGLQVFNPDGSVRLDTNTLLGRVLGSVAVAEGQQSGAIGSNEFLKGQAFLIGMFQLGVFTGTVLSGPAFSQVVYSVNGVTLNWSRSSNSREVSFPSGILYYGVF